MLAKKTVDIVFFDLGNHADKHITYLTNSISLSKIPKYFDT